MTSIFEHLQYALETGQLVALATLLAGPGSGSKLLVWPDGNTQGGLGEEELDRQVTAYASELLAEQRSERRTFKVGNEACDIFVEVYVPRPRLVIVGAVHIAIPLVIFARELGFHTTVVDARGVFATPERFSQVDNLILEWPADALGKLTLNESSYVAVLSHDDKLDVPALKVALESSARYIGALGSRKTMKKRVDKLLAMGITAEQLARIHNPIGLDLGGRKPEEIALAIMAEIVAVRYSGSERRGERET